ncbi:DUF3515 domain-containing protein [Corynebacterium terpenotabidum]|nr:DUF3515 domain-containing protein [Corynebacterium terpenotabidum]
MAEQSPGSPEVNDQGSSTGLSRTATVLSLVLAVVFVAAVLAGAKILVDRNVYTDVSMGQVDAPDAQSPACDRILDALPDRTADFRSVGVTDPAPAGAAAYRNSGGTELTVRCGVSVPAQFTTVSTTVDSGGTRWLRVDDATEGSDLSTWYTLSSPVVAVTGTVESGTSLDKVIDLAALGKAVAEGTDGSSPEPREVPLSDLEDATGTDAASSCTAFTDALPDSFGDYRRLTETTVASETTPAGTKLSELSDGDVSVAVWTADGMEPVVVRCGVAMPASYEAGVQLTQIDDVPWFEDTALGNGSTAGVWYALGYAGTVAVSLPLSAGSAVLPQISGIIAETMEKTGN